MGISGIAPTSGSMSVMQMTSADLKDHKSKSIQDEITDVQQKLQKLSSDEELSTNEKANEKEKLQKEKSSLDTELKQHQEELVRSQEREAMLAELRKEQNPLNEEDAESGTQTAGTSANTTDKEDSASDARQTMQPGTVITQSSDGTVILKEILNPAGDSTDPVQTRPADENVEATAAAEEPAPEEEETDTQAGNEFRPTAPEMQAMVSADTSAQIADRMGTLVAKTNDGIAVLKGEMKQDALRGTDTDRKQAELDEMQKQRKQEMAAQFSMLNEAGNTMKAAVGMEPANSAAQNDAGNHFQVSGLSVPPDENAAQQGFHVAIA